MNELDYNTQHHITIEWKHNKIATKTSDVMKVGYNDVMSGLKIIRDEIKV